VVLSDKIKRYVQMVLLISIGTMGVVSIAITSSRFGESEMIFNIIAQYFGEPFLNAGLHFWANVDSHLLGQRLFPDIYSLLGGHLQEFESAFSARDYYVLVTGVYTHHFKTLPIDLYIEFGIIGATVFVFILSFVGSLLLRQSGRVTFHSLIWVVYYYQIAFGAVFSFTKGGHDNFIRLIGLIIIYLYFRYNVVIARK